MSHDVSHSKEPIRLFKSDLLEFFTHTHPAVVAAIWGPVSLFFLVRAIVLRAANASPVYILVAFLIGVFLWTLAEYLLHRFLFHLTPHTPWQERLQFLLHGIHHAQPQVKTRLVMPLPVSIPMAVIFYALFHFIVGVILRAPEWVYPLMSGFLLGYLAYDLTHYATHHLPMRSGYAKLVKRHHMAHHYVDPNTRFGVSSPFWDSVFGTQGAS